MTTKRASKKQVKAKLIEDANNPDAWGRPITVPASGVPRPTWYGRSGHLELAAKFFVLSVLHRLGAEASLTSTRSDNVDITVVKQPGEAFTIQVKTLMGTSQWPVEKFSARKHHYVAFIRYDRESQDPKIAPDVYIWAVSPAALASKLDPKAAWKQFVARPAA
jgi:hypothetical protein